MSPCLPAVRPSARLVVHDAQARPGFALRVRGRDGVGRGGDLADLGGDGGLTLPEDRTGVGGREGVGGEERLNIRKP